MDAPLQRICDKYSARLAGKTGDECNTHPPGAPLCWSIQEVVEHLVLTYRLTAAQCAKYRARGLPTTKRATAGQLAARTLVITCGYFPRGVLAPEFVCPGRAGVAAMDGDALAAFLREAMRDLDAELASGEQLFGRRPLAAHFRFGPLTPRQWRRFHMVHARHHLGQLERIERALRAQAVRVS